MKKELRFRAMIVQEAARLMYEDGVQQFLDAKKLAAKRILGKEIKHLPSNGEISNALYQLSQFKDASTHQEKLYFMRIKAIEIMEQLHPFRPRLIGSVSTGRIRSGSDIDLHVFCDQVEELEYFITRLNWRYDRELVCIQKNNQLKEYLHLYLDMEYPVELSVYPLNEYKITNRSSTDGKPIKRLGLKQVHQLITEEHWDFHLKTANR